ncbi:hypothetical protein RUND412_003995 [Rhizina undulata]
MFLFSQFLLALNFIVNKELASPDFTSVLAVQGVSGVVAVDCDGYAISKSTVQNAAEEALGHLNAGTQVGRNGYPHQYKNYETFIFNAGCEAPYYEFPVFGSYIYTGGPPGCSRVIIGSWDGTNATFCGSITHCGASGNAFLRCNNTY